MELWSCSVVSQTRGEEGGDGERGGGGGGKINDMKKG